MEYSDSGALGGDEVLQRRYIRLPGSVDEPILMIDFTLDAACTDSSYATCEVWAHQNRLGSVVATSDSAGDKINTYTYSPYGEVGSEGASGFPFRFTGQKLDADTGLYYYKARWYDPETGRFMQTDPIGYGDGMNMYVYVGGDPVNATDPTGTQSLPEGFEVPDEYDWCTGATEADVILCGSNEQPLSGGPGRYDYPMGIFERDITVMDSYERIDESDQRGCNQTLLDTGFALKAFGAFFSIGGGMFTTAALIATPFAPQAAAPYVGLGLALSTTGIALEIAGAAVQGAALGGAQGAVTAASGQVGIVVGQGLLNRYFPLIGALTNRGSSVAGALTPLPERTLCRP